MALFVTTRKISYVEWLIGNARLKLLQWIAGRSRVAINLEIMGGSLTGPTDEVSFYMHNVHIKVESGESFSVEDIIRG